MQVLLRTLQDSMAAAAARERDVFSVGDFQVALSRHSDLFWLNYAVPIGPDCGETQIRELKRLFREHARQPRVEFIEALTPELPDMLEDQGFELQARMPVMICTKTTFRPCDSTGSVDILRWNDDPRGYLRAGASAFGDSSPIDETRIDRQRKLMRSGHYVCAQAVVDEQVVSVACILPEKGAAELAGVGTVQEYRRRGFASAVSSRLLEDLFSNPETEDTIAWLSAGDSAAKAVYERLGFSAVGDQCNYLAG